MPSPQPKGCKVIEVEDLVKVYDSLRAVDRLSLRVEGGQILGLVGPNGAGKTTTLRCLTGIIPPTEGRVAIAGFDLAEQPVEAKQRLAFVPDEPRLFDYLTAADHLAMTARLYGVEDGPRRSEALLEEFGLADRSRSFPSELSRGMKQKLMVAMALLHRPAALILDEPLTGLDPSAMRRMKDRIRATAVEGAAVIISSHMLHLVEEICGTIIILVRGRKELEGSLAAIREALPDLAGDADLEEIFIRATEDGELR
jgi:ABC-2 type transport system ATP-binding protein